MLCNIVPISACLKLILHLLVLKNGKPELCTLLLTAVSDLRIRWLLFLACVTQIELDHHHLHLWKIGHPECLKLGESHRSDITFFTALHIQLPDAKLCGVTGKHQISEVSLVRNASWQRLRVGCSIVVDEFHCTLLICRGCCMFGQPAFVAMLPGNQTILIIVFDQVVIPGGLQTIDVKERDSAICRPLK